MEDLLFVVFSEILLKRSSKTPRTRLFWQQILASRHGSDKGAFGGLWGEAGEFLAILPVAVCAIGMLVAVTQTTLCGSVALAIRHRSLYQPPGSVIRGVQGFSFV